MLKMARLVVLASALAALAAAGCSTDADCSLNGVCNSSGACTCDPGWVGPACGALNITTIDPSNGMNKLDAHTSSWGGNVIFASGVYHLFYSKMVGNCTLAQWTTNSACWHATSSVSPLGPFEDSGEVLSAFCHNAVPAVAPDGTWLLYHIGCGGSKPQTCASDGSVLGEREEEAAAAEAALPGSSMSCGVMNPTLLYSTGGPYGPWTPIGYQIINGTGSGQWDESVTNVSPYFYPNGTVLLAFRGKDSNKDERLGVASAPHWRGPYTKSTPGPILDGHAAEDSWPFVDRRGNYHLLFHDFSSTGPGGHAYATSWAGPWTLGTPPYTSAVTWANGTSTTVARRERPQIFFDQTSGLPRVLFNGVVPRPDSASMASFTMAAEIHTG